MPVLDETRNNPRDVIVSRLHASWDQVYDNLFHTME